MCVALTVSTTTTYPTSVITYVQTSYPLLNIGTTLTELRETRTRYAYKPTASTQQLYTTIFNVYLWIYTAYRAHWWYHHSIHSNYWEWMSYYATKFLKQCTIRDPKDKLHRAAFLILVINALALSVCVLSPYVYYETSSYSLSVCVLVPHVIFENSIAA